MLQRRLGRPVARVAAKGLGLFGRSDRTHAPYCTMWKYCTYVLTVLDIFTATQILRIGIQLLLLAVPWHLLPVM
jgi:hypothetical protein